MEVNHLPVNVETAVGRVQVEKAPANVTLRQAAIDAQFALLADTYAARLDVVDLKRWLAQKY